MKQYRDRVLGLAWLGYLNQGSGAIRLIKTRDGETIDYIPRRLINYVEVGKIVDENNPEFAAVVLYGQDDRYTILTLSGPKTPPECYADLPDELNAHG